MPIRPELRWLYPIDWPELSAVIRFERAQSRCERSAARMAKRSCTWAMADGGTRQWALGATVRAGRCETFHRLSFGTMGCSAHVWFWPVPISITTPLTTDRAISRRSASGATCSMTAASTSDVAALPCECGRPAEIYF